LSILKQRTQDLDVKRYAQGIMRDAGSLAYTREKCKSLKQDIITQIMELGGNPPLLKLIELLDVQVERLALPSCGITSSNTPTLSGGRPLNEAGSSESNRIDST
jgi:geranylgeranyl diphosphate synthase type 3